MRYNIHVPSKLRKVTYKDRQATKTIPNFNSITKKLKEELAMQGPFGKIER